jgi:cobalt/nickel transport system permease protein
MGTVVRADATGVLETAATRRSPLERLDGRVRIVAAAAFALVVVALPDFAALIVALAAAAGVMLAARLPVLRTLRRVVAMDTFIVFMIALLPFTVPGDPLFSVFGFPASREGLAEGARIALVANAVVLMAMGLLASFEPVGFGRALAGLGAPERLVHLLLFVVRYIDVLEQEQQRLRRAMRARCFRPATSRHTWISIGHLVGMMLIRALERSERILKAMKCRGFTDRLHLDAPPRLGRTDLVFASCFAGLLAGLVLWEVVRAAGH